MQERFSAGTECRSFRRHFRVDRGRGPLLPRPSCREVRFTLQLFQVRHRVHLQAIPLKFRATFSNVLLLDQPEWRWNDEPWHPREETLRIQRALRVVAYGNRHNAFGPLHFVDPSFPYTTPNTWHSTGKRWTDKYRLMPMGLLAAPRIETAVNPS